MKKKSLARSNAQQKKRGRPRRALNEPDTSREELVATLNKMRSEPSKLALNSDRDDDETIRLIKLCKKKLDALRDGTPYQKAECHDYISLFRKTESVRSIDPYAKLEDDEFLKCLIKECEDSLPPGGKRVFSDWPRGAVRESTLKDKRERDTRIAQGLSQLYRQEKSRMNRFVTDNEPNVGMLNDLQRRICAAHPENWATLRELKIATAIPEREIKRIVISLRPTKREIRKELFRHRFMKRGACPKRYALRLVRGVMKEFVSRLPALAVSDEEKERLRSLASAFCAR